MRSHYPRQHRDTPGRRPRRGSTTQAGRFTRANYFPVSELGGAKLDTGRKEADTRFFGKSGRQTVYSPQIGEKKLAWPVCLLLIALIVPWVLPIGAMRLSLYRIVLLVMILPCSRSPGMKTTDGAPALAACAATELARLPVEAQA